MSAALSPGGVPFDAVDATLADQLKAERLSKKDTEVPSPFPSEDQLKAWVTLNGTGIGPSRPKALLPGEHVFIERYFRSGPGYDAHYWMTNYGRTDTDDRRGGYPEYKEFDPYPLTTEECEQLRAINRAMGNTHFCNRDNTINDHAATLALGALLEGYKQQKRLRPTVTDLERFARHRDQYIRSSAQLEQEKSALEEEKRKLAEAQAPYRQALAALAVEQRALEAEKQKLAAAKEALKVFTPLLDFLR